MADVTFVQDRLTKLQKDIYRLVREAEQDIGLEVMVYVSRINIGTYENPDITIPEVVCHVTMQGSRT